jgi:hypothetical protein
MVTSFLRDIKTAEKKFKITITDDLTSHWKILEQGFQTVSLVLRLVEERYAVSVDFSDPCTGSCGVGYDITIGILST